VHALGEVWTAMLWDMYWAFSNQYGWDADPKNINSGNGKAIRLVMDGLKLQPCSPGFIDGRDAILAADRADFAGANQCLIWDVFARRGLGYNAKQGSSNITDDNTENFDKNPYCVKQLKLIKTADDNVDPGGQITYKLRVVNHKGTAVTGVVVKDTIPAFTAYVGGSATNGGTVAGNIITFNIGNMNNNDTINITYKVLTTSTRRSVSIFYDGMEQGDRNWDLSTVAGSVPWQVNSSPVHAGTKAWAVGYPSGNGVNDQSLFNLNPIAISGAQPVLRFWHNYDTEAGSDGGIVQASSDNGSTWYDLGDKMFRNGYRGLIAYTTFVVPNQKAFWGNNQTWQPCYVDLSSYVGQNVKFRFRFATDSLVQATGWFMDDFQVMDMLSYNATAKVTDTQGDTATAFVLGRGTTINPVGTNAVIEAKGDIGVKVYPNPTKNLFNILVTGSSAEADLTVYNTSGQVIIKKRVNSIDPIPVDLSTHAAGMYFVKLETDKGIVVEKVVKE
jgi:extracellular elastinolytic metalloproteinase